MILRDGTACYKMLAAKNDLIEGEETENVGKRKLLGRTKSLWASGGSISIHVEHSEGKYLLVGEAEYIGSEQKGL